ncbi:MAG: hypothetical protein ACM3UL_01535 [Ignavibacteria bacterium]
MSNKTIKFQRSGHFWNDLGIIGLWRWLAETAPDIENLDRSYRAIFSDCEGTLYADRLEVSGEESNIRDILRQAVDALRAQTWQTTQKGKMWWNGPASFLYAGQNTPDFLLPYEDLPESSQWRRSGRCDVCGNGNVPVRTTGTSYNPLLVNLDKMSSFYSELKGRYHICQSCAFVAPFALTQVWYSWGDQFLTLVLLWPTSADLLAVEQFLHQTSYLHISDNVGRNYERAFSYANSPASCFLDLVCSLWNTSKTHLSADALMMALSGVQFNAMLLSKPTKTSHVISIDRYEIFPDPIGILRLAQGVDQVSKQGKVWNVLISVLNDMLVKWRGPDGKIQADTRLLDEIANAIVTRTIIEGILEERVYRALNQLHTDSTLLNDFNILAFRLLVPIYLKEVNDVDIELLPALQSVGETLGELVKLTDDRSILYNLRNARNAEDLLEVLSRVVVRYADVFVEGKPELWRNNVRELAELLDGSNWRRVRSLLGLYAGLKFIELSRKEQGKEPAPAHS